MRGHAGTTFGLVAEQLRNIHSRIQIFIDIGIFATFSLIKLFTLVLKKLNPIYLFRRHSTLLLSTSL